jgi:kynurenine formamidase
LIDLSRPLENDMPVFPGDAPPRFDRTRTVDRDGFNVTALRLGTHVGTHLDAPAHLAPTGATLDQMPLESFAGPGLVVDVSQAGPVVGPDFFRPLAPDIRRADFLLLQTGRGPYWGRPEYFDRHPVLDPPAAAYLMDLGLKGLGLDAASVDPVDSTTVPVHRALLERGAIIIENLAHLDRPPRQGFIFWALPLLLRGGDGSPVRAAAWVDG